MPAFTDILRQHFNSEITDIDTDAGTATIRVSNPDGSTAENKIDYRAMQDALSKKMGMPLELSSPEAPLKESGLSFLQQFAMAESRTKLDKANFLKGEMGADNVRFNPKTGEFSVFKDGVWKRGELSEGWTGVAAEIAGQSGLPIAGSIKGAAIGATAGATAGGIGAIPGAIIGAGLGAMVGKMANIGIAYASGVRTESDAADVGVELGKEFIYGLAGESLSAGIRTAPKIFAKAVSKLKPQMTSEASKLTLAETMSQFNRLDVVDNLTVLDRPMEVLPHQEKTIKWMQSGMKNLDSNPVLREMTDIVSSTAEKSYQSMQSAYDDALKTIAPQLRSTAVDMKDVFPSIKSMYVQMGLVDDASGKWLKESERSLVETVKPKTVNALKKIYGRLEAATELGEGVVGKQATGVLNIQEAQGLVRNIDEIMEPSMTEQISSIGKRRLTQIRSDLQNRIEGSIARIDGDAAAKYAEVRAKYSTLRSWLDDVMPQLDPARIQGTVKNMLNPDTGMMNRQAFKDLLNGTGVNADKVMRELQNRQAGIASAPLWAPGTSTSGISALLDKTIMAPLTSPRISTRMVAKLTPTSVADLAAKGKAAEFVSKMKPQERMYLLRNPDMLRTISQTITQASQITDQQSKELKQYGIQKIQGR